MICAVTIRRLKSLSGRAFEKNILVKVLLCLFGISTVSCSWNGEYNYVDDHKEILAGRQEEFINFKDENLFQLYCRIPGEELKALTGELQREFSEFLWLKSLIAQVSEKQYYTLMAQYYIHNHINYMGVFFKYQQSFVSKLNWLQDIIDATEYW